MATQPSPNSSAYLGFQEPRDGGAQLNALTFLFRRLMAKVWTVTLFQVVAVTNAGTDDAVGFVDVMPMVHQVDGAGNATPHGVIHNVPYFRLQGGANAIILDPQVNDIGMGLIASRDISAVKAKKAPNVPGSSRRFDPADALYIGGVLNGIPTQYVQFNTSGVTVVSPTKITAQAPEIDLTATTKIVVTAPEVDVNASTKVIVTSPDVELGAVGGKKVALDGDPVVGGVVVASSTKVKAT